MLSREIGFETLLYVRWANLSWDLDDLYTALYASSALRLEQVFYFWPHQKIALEIDVTSSLSKASGYREGSRHR